MLGSRGGLLRKMLTLLSTATHAASTLLIVSEPPLGFATTAEPLQAAVDPERLIEDSPRLKAGGF
jgi:hypothetical protein